ncbi:MAG: globin [Gammaproteobacteria bacterium]|nr:globin [Gammaproteobacteria bacterium]
MSEPLLDSLELAAAKAGDIAPAVYERYFERCPDSRTIMIHTDSYMRGRMLDEVFRLLMSGDVEEEREYLEFETTNHRAYGAAPHMYENVLLAVRDVVTDVLGSEFSAEMDVAWKQRVQELLAIIRLFTAAA